VKLLHVKVDDNGLRVPFPEFLRVAGFEDSPEKRREVVTNLNTIFDHVMPAPEVLIFAEGDDFLHAAPEAFGRTDGELRWYVWDEHERKKHGYGYMSKMAVTIRKAFAETDRLLAERVRAADLVAKLSPQLRPVEGGYVYDGDLDAISVGDLQFLKRFAEQHPPRDGETHEDLLSLLEAVKQAHLAAYRAIEEGRRQLRRIARAANRPQPQQQETKRCSSCEKKPAYVDGKCKKCLRAEGLLPTGKVT
jgi:hypothetical protein